MSEWVMTVLEQAEQAAEFKKMPSAYCHGVFKTRKRQNVRPITI